jgi:hypothetical protein
MCRGPDLFRTGFHEFKRLYIILAFRISIIELAVSIVQHTDCAACTAALETGFGRKFLVGARGPARPAVLTQSPVRSAPRLLIKDRDVSVLQLRNYGDSALNLGQRQIILPARVLK